MKNLLKAIIISTLIVFLGAVSANAATYTTIGLGGGDGISEPTLNSSPGLLDTLYGKGNWSRQDDDFDKFWVTAGLVSVTVEASYAGQTNAFGWIDAGTGSFNLLTTTPPGPDGQTASFTTTTTTPFTFGIHSYPTTPPGYGDFYWSSDPTHNNDTTKDHMVTYAITDGIYKGDWILAFEDISFDDYDYNDLVIHVSGVNPVPLPTTLMLFSSGLMSLFWFRRKK